MELTELYIRCLFAAAKTREMIKREWLLEAMTVVSEYSHDLTTNGSAEIHTNSIVEFPGAEPVATIGQIVCIDKKYLGIVLNDAAMTLTVGVLLDSALRYSIDSIRSSLVHRWLGSSSERISSPTPFCLREQLLDGSLRT